jgi:hypothetical protein
MIAAGTPAELRNIAEMAREAEVVHVEGRAGSSRTMLSLKGRTRLIAAKWRSFCVDHHRADRSSRESNQHVIRGAAGRCRVR